MTNQLTSFSETETNLPKDIIEGIASGIGSELGGFAIDKIFEFAGIGGDDGMSDLLKTILDKLNNLEHKLDTDFKAIMDKLNIILANQSFAEIKGFIDMNKAAYGPGYILDLINPKLQTNLDSQVTNLKSLLEAAQIGKACDSWHSSLYGVDVENPGYLQLLIQEVSNSANTKVLSSLPKGTAQFFDQYWAHLDAQQAVTFLLWAQYQRYTSISDKYDKIKKDDKNPYNKDPESSPDYIAAVAATGVTIGEKIEQYKENRKLQLSVLRGMYSSQDTRSLDGEATPINHLPTNVIIDKTNNKMWYPVLSGRLAINIRISNDCDIPANQANPLGVGNPSTMTQKDSAGINAYLKMIVDTTGLTQWKVPDTDTLKDFINGLGGKIGVSAGGDWFIAAIKENGFTLTEAVADTIWISKYDYRYLEDYNNFTNSYYAFLEGSDWRSPTKFEEGCMLMLYRDITPAEAEMYWY